jgi:hypothetical protein
MTKRLTRPHKKTGRPTEFRPIFVKRAYEACLLGLPDERIASLLGVNKSTLQRWKNQHPAFAQAFERGRDQADAKVAGALYKRAMGYSHPAVKIHVTKDGEVIKVPYIQHYPPDAATLAYYLSNRQRELWRRDPVGGSLDVNLSLESLISEVVKAREARQVKVIELIEHQPQDAESKDAPKPDDSSS